MKAHKDNQEINISEDDESSNSSDEESTSSQAEFADHESAPNC